uniref:Thyrotropin-releasing hormone receptor n=1 Tax=Schmidtea mediterranea TaxID=79327 RepID=A0A193KU86_SCHMD|nr:GCR053 [Schmidtea mediterranea]
MSEFNNRTLSLGSEGLSVNKVENIYYSKHYKAISIISSTIILFFGLIGNLSVSIILTFAKNMQSSTNCYLVSVAVADILVLLSTIVPFLYNINQDINISLLPSWGCSLIIYLQYLSVNSSALTITSFSFERWVAICYPMKAHTMCTISRAVKIVIGIWIFNLIYNSSWIYLTGIVKKGPLNGSYKSVCTFRFERRKYMNIYMFDFMLFYCIPLLLTTFLYCAIIRTLVKRPMSGTTSGRDPRKHMNHSKMQVVKMLMAVVILFAMLWLPYRALMVYNSFASKSYLDLWFLLFARIMVFINSAINPILYNALSGKFRKAFKKFFLYGVKR